MADEVDPIAQMAASHIEKMGEINALGISKLQELSDHAASEFRRFSGLRSTALEKLLTSAGIIPAEAATDATSE